MHHRWLVLLIAWIWLFAGASPGLAMYQKLNPDQIQEAVDYGRRNARTEITEFIREWVSRPDSGHGAAFLITEFLALAHAAREFSLRGAEPTPFDIQDALARSSGKLVFRVTTVGEAPDFAKEYRAVVQQDDKTLLTTYWTNGNGERYEAGRNSPPFAADSDFFFPAAGINPNNAITLIVLDKDGQTVSRFRFDLAHIR